MTTFSTPEGLVFEDVSSHGYHTQFELNGLTKEQSLMALDKLAHFHAASALLLEKVNLLGKNYLLQFKSHIFTRAHSTKRNFRKELFILIGKINLSTSKKLIVL